MHWITDTENGIQSFLNPIPFRLEELSPSLVEKHKDLVQGVFHGADLKGVRILKDLGDLGFPLVLHLNDAPKSNLDMLTDMLRRNVALPNGLVCLADKGQGFLGRHDRTWECMRGNLHVVVYYQPNLTLENTGPAFSILGAIACLDALLDMDLKEVTPSIKWINDIFVGDHKVAGMLTRQTYKDPFITDLLLGVGVNINNNPDLPKNPFIPSCSNLKSLYPRTPWSCGEFLLLFLNKLTLWMHRLVRHGFDPLFEFYREHSSVLGQEVRIYEDGYGFEKNAKARKRIASGRVKAISKDLSLILSTSPKPISNGRLCFEKDCLD